MTFLISPSSLVIVTSINRKYLSLAFSDRYKRWHVSWVRPLCLQTWHTQRVWLSTLRYPSLFSWGHHSCLVLAMSPTPQVLITGHSFVHRFHTFLAQGYVHWKQQTRTIQLLKEKRTNRSIQIIISAKHTAFITLHVLLRWSRATSPKTSYVQKQRTKNNIQLLRQRKKELSTHIIINTKRTRSTILLIMYNKC